MGRAGIEPATLGLKVRPERPPQLACCRNVLQQTPFACAASSKRLPFAETNPYSHSYSRGRVKSTAVKFPARLAHGGIGRQPSFEIRPRRRTLAHEGSQYLSS